MPQAALNSPLLTRPFLLVSVVAGVLIAAVPAILLFTFLQRYIVQGLTAGAVKG